MDIAFIVTFTGLVITFMALIALNMLISASSKVLNAFGSKNSNNGGNNAKTNGTSRAPGTESDTAVAYEIANINNNINSNNLMHLMHQHDEEELIAVLTAAIMASERKAPGFKAKIKSVRRINNISPAWSYAGLMEQIGNRL
ncbi:MAG: hypothetical protein GX754_11675 [Clostridiaceae bacterium]|nr:hypothetical protein [Clostridiaceae bacterium]